MALTISVDEIVQGSGNPLLAIRPHWKRVRLREVASVLNGFAFKSSQFTKGEGMPLIRIRDVGGDITDTNYVGEFDDRYLVEPGDLLIGMDGDFNCARWSGPRGLLNQRVCKVTLRSDQYHPRFLNYALPGYLKAINDATSSVTVKHLSSRTVEDIPLPFPPLNEQKGIVADLDKEFSRLDESIENLKRVQINLKRYGAAVLKAAVEGRLVPTEAELARREGRSYETGLQLLEQILANHRRKTAGKANSSYSTGLDTAELPELPEGWAWATMPQLGELSRGKSKHRPRDDPKLYGGPYPFVQTGDIRKSGGTVTEYSQTYSELGLRQSRLWPAGTLCITIAANIADTGILSFPACFPDSVVGFAHEGDPHTTRYIEKFLRTAKGDLERFAPATAQKNISLAVLQRLVIPFPPLAEQCRIVEELESRLSVVKATAAQTAEAHRRAERSRLAMLQNVFSGGNLSVPDTHDNRYQVGAGQRNDQDIEATMEEDLLVPRHIQEMAQPLDGYGLLELIRSRPSGLAPSTLFRAAGYSHATVDLFYANLNTLLKQGHLVEERPSEANVFLRALT